MTDPAPEILERPDAPPLAYHRHGGRADRPGVLVCGGFRSSMAGEKARFLEQAALARGLGFVRFDYRGHGASGGVFEQATIGAWRDDALAVIDRLTAGPQILVGSSMGAWIATLLALARPGRVAGLLAVAPALDFTEALIWRQGTPEQQRHLMAAGRIDVPSRYEAAGYPITRDLVVEGRRHLLLGGPIALPVPVRIVHGMADADVPWRHGLAFAEALVGGEVHLTLVRDGDHRLSRPQDLALLAELLDGLLRQLPS